MPGSLSSPQPDFLRLFRGDRYRFEFGIRPLAADWFRLAPAGLPELAERRRLLGEHPERHLPWSGEADVVLDELLALFAEPEVRALAGGGAGAARKLAGGWEPDFVLLRRAGGDEFRMVGACVCGPSSWDPAEKLGQPVTAIHTPVPSLNHELGARIRTFLERLPPGGVFTRENWGLASVPDRNLHPALARPRLGADTPLAGVWLRVEHQAFHALPRSGGIVFVIWLTIHPLVEVVRDPLVSAAFEQMLRTMPDEIARYKSLFEARPGLVAQLDAMLGR